MRKCPKCGQTYDDSWSICLHCSTLLENPNVPKPIKSNEQIIKEETKRNTAELEQALNNLIVSVIILIVAWFLVLIVWVLFEKGVLQLNNLIVADLLVFLIPSAIFAILYIAYREDGAKKLIRKEYSPGFLKGFSWRNYFSLWFVYRKLVELIQQNKYLQGAKDRLRWKTNMVKVFVIVAVAAPVLIAILQTAIDTSSYIRGKEIGYHTRDRHAEFITNSTSNYGINYAKAYNNRGFNNYKKGDLNQAILDFNKAIEMVPNYVSAYYNRGLTYYCTEQYDKAIADYRKAIALRPSDREAYDNFIQYVPEKKPSDERNARDEILELFKEKTDAAENKKFVQK